MLENLTLQINENILTIRVDLSQKGRPSKNTRRQRTMVISSSNGSVPLVNPDGSYREETLNMSIWRAAKPHEIEDYNRFGGRIPSSTGGDGTDDTVLS